ncbi:hypothetical protein L484_002542 [Morus notabilis]|uniref:Uncharacterized protein n=1 Tax=Morus notabilis TaxID=981085 RepID=W9RWB1_9ROSA|nr:hypothetical protein L484_002542 [Morus notabilis]
MEFRGPNDKAYLFTATKRKGINSRSYSRKCKDACDLEMFNQNPGERASVCLDDGKIWRFLYRV